MTGNIFFDKLSKMITTNILLLIGTKLRKEDVYTFCQLNKTTRNICQNELFWQQRLEKEYGDFFIVTKPNNKNLFNWYRDLMNYNIFNIEPISILKFAHENGFAELENYIRSSLEINSLIIKKNYEELKKIKSDRDILFISSHAWILLIGENNYNIILFLLKNHANIHVNADNPLRWASSLGHTEIVKLLLEKGANPYNDQALIDACRGGYTQIVQLLLKYGTNPDNALSLASATGHTEIVNLLLLYGANPHADNDEPLRWASSLGHTEVVKLFLEKGANPYNDQVLIDACRWGYTQIVQLLLKYGANPDNALSLASAAGHAEIVNLLLLYGANPHADNDKPLKQAQINGHSDIVKLLKAAMLQTK